MYLLTLVSGRQRHLHFFCLSPYGRVTAMLLAVSVTFIALHTPNHAIRLVRLGKFATGQNYQSIVDVILHKISELLYYTNYVTNCVTYFTFGKAFRDMYKQYYCSCFRKLKLPALFFRSSKGCGDGVEFVQCVCESTPIEMETAECTTDHNYSTRPPATEIDDMVLMTNGGTSSARSSCSRGNCGSNSLTSNFNAEEPQEHEDDEQLQEETPNL